MSEELRENTTVESVGSVAPGAVDSGTLRATSELISHARAELGRVISGQTHAVEEVLIAVLCQGHALLEGVPGIAKTLMVSLRARATFPPAALTSTSTRPHSVRVFSHP